MRVVEERTAREVPWALCWERRREVRRGVRRMPPPAPMREPRVEERKLKRRAGKWGWVLWGGGVEGEFGWGVGGGGIGVGGGGIGEEGERAEGGDVRMEGLTDADGDEGDEGGMHEK